jgi:hypothetical protein
VVRQQCADGLAQLGEGLHELLLLFAAEVMRETLQHQLVSGMDSVDECATLRGELREKDPAIGTARPAHQPLAFEAVDKSGHVCFGHHQLASYITQGERFVLRRMKKKKHFDLRPRKVEFAQITIE